MPAPDSLCARLHAVNTPLRLEPQALRDPQDFEVLLKVRACAVCRTDLHVVDGDIDARLPIVPGHEIVGEVIARGARAQWPLGARVGAPWLGFACGECEYCRAGRENLCDRALFTGCHLDGGYAQHALADSRFCFEIPSAFDDVHAAPLLCAGLIGYRALRMAGPAQHLGIYGFGAAAHLVTQVAVWQSRSVYAFTRTGDANAQALARELGAVYAGDSATPSPQQLDAAIIFAPVGALVPTALAALRKGGVVVCGGIHMSDIPQFPYELLWGERSICSVANLTRADAVEFLSIAPQAVRNVRVETYSLHDANTALSHLREGRVSGAAVITP